jgi:osmotically-inducible protein OsmY
VALLDILPKRCLPASAAFVLLAALVLVTPGHTQELEVPGSAPAASGAPPAEGATDREITAELDQNQDRRIADRLRATFARVDALRGIRVAVNAGVVQLTGEVPSTAARDLAGQLARQVEDVALVENELQTIQDVGPRPMIPRASSSRSGRALR